MVALALVPNGIMDVWFSYREQKDLLFRLQREQAKSAAEKIGQFVKEIEGQMSWATQLPVATESDEEWRIDAVRLLRQAPAVTEFTHLDANGRERFRMSREAMDVIGSQSDFSHDPVFTEAKANKVYYGPVYFVHGSEPYMTIALAGARPADGVVVAKSISNSFGTWYRGSRSACTDKPMSWIRAANSSPIRISALCCVRLISHDLHKFRRRAKRHSTD